MENDLRPEKKGIEIEKYCWVGFLKVFFFNFANAVFYFPFFTFLKVIRGFSISFPVVTLYFLVLHQIVSFENHRLDVGEDIGPAM